MFSSAGYPDILFALADALSRVRQDAEEISRRPVFSVGGRVRVLAAAAPGISARLATGCGEAIVTVFDPSTGEYT